MRVEVGYGYDDLLLRPAYSELKHRLDPDLSFQIGSMRLEVPIFSAPMDTVTGRYMAIFLQRKGALGVLHRYCSIDEEYREVRLCKDAGVLVAASIGVNGDAEERAKALLDAGVDMLVIDVAHGHSIAVLNFTETLKLKGASLVMSANIATPEAACDSLSAGADLLRVGVGAGSACTTRVVTGVGVPQLSAIMDIREAVGPTPIIVADGGIRTSGDIVKALAAGANAVMLGGMLSRYSIAPKPGIFRGMASDDALSDYKPDYAVAPEGETFITKIIYNFEAHFGDLISAIKQGFAYLGAKDLQSLQQNAQWTQVTSLGYGEGEAHFQGGQ